MQLHNIIENYKMPQWNYLRNQSRGLSPYKPCLHGSNEPYQQRLFGVDNKYNVLLQNYRNLEKRVNHIEQQLNIMPQQISIDINCYDVQMTCSNIEQKLENDINNIETYLKNDEPKLYINTMSSPLSVHNLNAPRNQSNGFFG